MATLAGMPAPELWLRTRLGSARSCGMDRQRRLTLHKDTRRVREKRRSKPDRAIDFSRLQGLEGSASQTTCDLCGMCHGWWQRRRLRSWTRDSTRSIIKRLEKKRSNDQTGSRHLCRLDVLTVGSGAKQPAGSMARKPSAWLPRQRLREHTTIG